MNSPADFQETHQNSANPVHPILINFVKYISVGAAGGFAVGLIVGIIMAFLNVSGTKPPSFSSETLTAMTESRSLALILLSAGGFGVIGLGLILLSWLAARFQSKKN